MTNLRTWEELDHFRMLGVRLSKDNFRSKFENISFLSRVILISKGFSFSAKFRVCSPETKLHCVLNTVQFLMVKLEVE